MFDFILLYFNNQLHSTSISLSSFVLNIMTVAHYQHFLFLFCFICSAPGQPPQNVEWNLIGSQLILQWDPVIALETESEVTGYIVLYRRHQNNDMYSIITNKTSAELTLNPNDNYVIQIKSLSEGGLGEGSEPIHIHQLSMGARGSRSGRLCSLSLSPLLICALSSLGAS